MSCVTGLSAMSGIKRQKSVSWLACCHCHLVVMLGALSLVPPGGSLPCMETAAELLFRYVLLLRACVLSSTTSNEGGESAAVVLMQNL